MSLLCKILGHNTYLYEVDIHLIEYVSIVRNTWCCRCGKHLSQEQVREIPNSISRVTQFWVWHTLRGDPLRWPYPRRKEPQWRA